MRIHEIICERKITLDEINDLIVWENPSRDDLRNLLNTFGELRGNAGPNTPFYVWPASKWVHHTIQKYLGHMPYYYYLSKTKNVRAEEWRRNMRKIGDIFVGCKGNDEEDATIPLEQPMVKRAI